MLPALLRYTLFEDHMYWVDEKEIYMHKANKFTGKNVTVLVKDAFSPKDLHIYHPQRQPRGKRSEDRFQSVIKTTIN